MGVRRYRPCRPYYRSLTLLLYHVYYYTIEVGVAVALIDAGWLSSCAVLSPYLLRLVYSLLCNIGNRRKKAIRAELLPG